MPPPSGPSSSRRLYIDWARGVAVLLMIEAHTFDAWTRPIARAGRAFSYSSILGGFAAPLFLWLAGVGVALSAASVERRTGNRSVAVDAVCRRGLAIFILAFAFRLQSFIVTPGSYPVTIFRVDILNIMGPAIVAAGLVWALTAKPAGLTAAFAALAGVTAMITPVVRTSPLVNLLPLWAQWYVRPMGDYTTFTLFPWSGFVFAGAACGVWLTHVRNAIDERRIQVSFALAGTTLVAIGFFTAARPSIYAESSFWTSSPTYFAIRVGVLTAAFATLYAAACLGDRYGFRLPWLARLGRSSLFVYWIHVELVYGYATWPLRHRLTIWGSALAFVLFSALMYAAVLGRDRIVIALRARRSLAPATWPRLGRQPNFNVESGSYSSSMN